MQKRCESYHTFQPYFPAAKDKQCFCCVKFDLNHVVPQLQEHVYPPGTVGGGRGRAGRGHGVLLAPRLEAQPDPSLLHSPINRVEESVNRHGFMVGILSKDSSGAGWLSPADSSLLLERVVLPPPPPSLLLITQHLPFSLAAVCCCTHLP